MKRLAVVLAGAAFLAMGATSDINCTVPNIVVVAPPLKVVTVKYLNHADADVAVAMLYHKDDDKDRGDLRDDGSEIDTLVKMDESQNIVLDCDRAGSLMVDKAKLLVVADMGPSTDSDALHIGHDYECGDTVTVDFYNNPSQTDLYMDVFLN
jgi:hypothetical protein